MMIWKMTNPGYSGTPLIKKLGITPGSRLLLINAPAAYMEWLGNDVSDQLCTNKEVPDIVHLFAAAQQEFQTGLQRLLPTSLKNPAIVVWVSWYKKSSGIKTDLTENSIRDFALKQGWVDIKVCAVSEEWSGLKLVIPLAKRKK